MSKKRIVTVLILIILSLLCLFFPFSSCSASEVAEEKVYQITETELIELLNNNTKGIALNNELQARLQEQETELVSLRAELVQYKNRLTELKQTTARAELLSQQQEKVWKETEKSLNEYIEEEKRKNNELKWQRNIAYVVLAGVLLNNAFN